MKKAVVKSDHYKGGYLAAEHLVQCGCNKIVCLKEPSGYSSGNERYRGYLAVCEKYGLKEQSVDCTYVYEEGIRAVGKCWNNTLMWDGVIAGNDMIAMAVYKELTRMGKKIPQEVQLIGFDDVKFGQIFTPRTDDDPSVHPGNGNCCSTDHREMCRRAALAEEKYI